MREFWMYTAERDERAAKGGLRKATRAADRAMDALFGDWLEASQDATDTNPNRKD